MPIRVKCDGCKKTLSVKEHLAGKKIKCPVCQQVILVSSASPTKEAAAGSKPSPDPVPKKPAPTAKPAPPGAAVKPAVKTKPTEEKPESNGTPVNHPPKSNGTPAPPEVVERPPENVEEEALSAWADEPPSPEELKAPEFIEFKCQWCDEPVKLPLDMAGKQAQCPHEDCRRIIKVPMPKAPEKKDWKKMDTKGPALAKINQPEQLENAWGTEVASKAKQSSLVEAGVIDVTPKGRPRDIFDWFRIGFYILVATILGGAAAYGLYSMYSAKRQINSLKQVRELVEGKKPKITGSPLLMAEAHRTIGLLYLTSQEKDPAYYASNYFAGASGVKPADQKGLNEQLFLIDVALSQIELGGDGDDLLGGARMDWKSLPEQLEATIRNIRDPGIQASALRAVGTRLFEKGQPELAIGLTSKFSSALGKSTPPPAYQQQIALIFARDDKETLKNLPAEKNVKDLNVRVGYAEGHARKGDFEKADQLIKAKGLARDRLDACIGVAAVALGDAKNNHRAGDFVKQAIDIANEKGARPSDWQLLQLVQLAARTESGETATEIAAKLGHREYKLRAELEMFLAVCDASAGIVSPDALAGIEAADKAPQAKGKQESSAGVTLALAWTALARRNAQLGYGRATILKMLDDRVAMAPPPIDVEILRGMIELGVYQGQMK